jgi:glyoxylase I family protein
MTPAAGVQPSRERGRLPTRVPAPVAIASPSSRVGLGSIRVSAIDHLDLVVTSLERSLAFYRGLLMPLGYVRVSEIAGERGEQVLYLGRVGGMGSVSLREAQSDVHPVPYDRYGIGLHHLAFSAASRAAVDERAGWLREQGAQIESGPGEHDYTPGYYAVFFYDPDGIKLEIVHKPTEGDLVDEVRRLQARLERLERERGS